MISFENISLQFELNREGTQFLAREAETETVCCVLDHHMLDFSILYDFQEKPPLHMKAAAKIGDRVCIQILPYRMELYVNDILLDEEWPCGNHALNTSEFTDYGCGLFISEIEKEEKEEPAVLGTFQDAESWEPGPGIFVGDCMPFSHEGVYHVLYLKDRHHHQSKWGLGAHQWNHISTVDFKEWNIHPMAVEIDDQWEGSICTGSWIFDGNRHYLFYTVRMCDGSPARICRSISEDGYHFKKDRDFSFTLSEKYTAPSARDPKIVKDDQGIFHMILTSSLAKEGNGCLVHLISKDLKDWKEQDEPLYVASKDMWEPECPDYFYKDGYYYLVYSLYGKGYYQYSEKPFSEWRIPEDPIIPCEAVPKAAVWRDRLIFTGFKRMEGYAGTLTFMEATVGEDGQLKWQN